MAEELDDAESGSGSRPFWSGTITFGLVSIPVSLFPANRPRSQGVSFRMVAAEGAPLERRYVCPEEDIEIGWEEIVRGYEVKKGKYVVVSDEELEAIEPRKSRDIDLQLFVDVNEIPPIYFDRAYFLAPAGGSNKAYRLLAEVMERKGRAGIASFVMRAKEYLVAILAENGILRAETLRFADEIRTPSDVGLPEKKKSKPADVKRFTAAIGKHRGKVDFRELINDFPEKVEALAAKKKKKDQDVIRVAAESGPEEGEVVDLLEVLRRSLDGKAKPARTSTRRGAPKRSSTKKSGKKKPSTKSSVATKDELMKQAKRLDIAGRSSMTKAELARAVRKSA